MRRMVIVLGDGVDVGFLDVFGLLLLRGNVCGLRDGLEGEVSLEESSKIFLVGHDGGVFVARGERLWNHISWLYRCRRCSIPCCE